jgi:hypothetical protein
LFAVLVHPQSRISIHRCINMNALIGAGLSLEAILAAVRGDLCKIPDMNFREYLFHALG